jgi:polyisoprenoid-binding protein YceI
MTTTSPASLAAGRWTVDLTNSTATFRVGNLGHTVTGTVPIIEGTVEVDAAGRPLAITGSLDLGAIDTGNPRRDKDLRKPRLLDLDRHPVMTFAASSVTTAPDGWSVAGLLTARGNEVRVTGEVDVSTRDGSVILTAHTWLDRRAVGVRAPRFMIGHRVEITVSATIRPDDVP